MNNIYQTVDLLTKFKSKLTKLDLLLLKNFDLILTDTELELRSRDVKAQFEMLERRYIIQKIATSDLNVEVVIYDSVFSCYPNTRLGVFI